MKNMGFVGTPLISSRTNFTGSCESVCKSSRQLPVVKRQRANINMGIFGLGFPELAVIAGVGIFIFGPSKVAELGKDLGGLAGGVKKATSEFRDAMQDSLDEADRELEQKKLEKDTKETNVESSTTASSEPVEGK